MTFDARGGAWFFSGLTNVEWPRPWQTDTYVALLLLESRTHRCGSIADVTSVSERVRQDLWTHRKCGGSIA
jgi:hypothetical protein